MALLFIESFDHCDINHFGAKWSVQTNTPSFVTGRNGTGSAWRTQDNGRTLTKIFNTDYTTLYMGFGWQYLSARNGVPQTPGCNFLIFSDDSTQQIALWITTNQKIAVYRQGTLLGTGSTTINLDEWHYLEVKVTFATGTSGSIVLRIDGLTELNLTGINTAPSGNAKTNRVMIGTSNAFTSRDLLSAVYDDLYILDDTGTVNNNFLGDIRVEALLPNANGSNSDFTNSAGNKTNNYLYVDESSGTFPDNDTTYVASGTVNERDSYNLQSLSSSTPGNIYGVQVSAFMRKDDAGIKQASTFVRTNATNYDDAPVNLSDSYKYVSVVRELNPNGNVAWDLTAINGLEAGVKVAS